MSSSTTPHESTESHTSSTKHPTLRIISYNHDPPCTPPDLQYDVRRIHNPPHEIRAAHTGLSKVTREHLLKDDLYRATVERAEAQIREEMDKKLQGEGEGDATVRVGCMCGSGHHRSVALAQELREREWPEDWDVEVDHRNLTDEVMAETVDDDE